MDIVELELRAGSWEDGYEYLGQHLLADFAAFHTYGSPPPDVDQLIGPLRQIGLEPWKTTSTTQRYFANSSSDTMALLVAVYQTLGPMLLTGAVEEAGRRLMSTVLERLPRDSERKYQVPSLAEASEVVQQYFVRRDRIAPDDLEEIAASAGPDGFEFLVRVKGSERSYQVLCSPDGRLVGRVSLGELEMMRALSQAQLTQDKT